MAEFPLHTEWSKMRSTKASAAVERLKRRSGNPLYSMSTRADGQFVLFVLSPDGKAEPLGDPLPMDEFVRFVDGCHPEKPKPVSKFDAAFRAQLKKAKDASG